MIPAQSVLNPPIATPGLFQQRPAFVRPIVYPLSSQFYRLLSGRSFTLSYPGVFARELGVVCMLQQVPVAVPHLVRSCLAPRMHSAGLLWIAHSEMPVLIVASETGYLLSLITPHRNGSVSP